jgi:ribosomal protein S18 acetylase RimI-like enzyme
VADKTPKSPKIRSFKGADAAVCKVLYTEGLIAGKIGANDTGLDIDDIERAYIQHPGSNFWVAVDEKGEIVGMIGVQHHEEGVGAIRRLRVRQDHRHKGLGSELLDTAVKFCQETQLLKVALDTRMDREAATKVFEKYHFRLTRAREVHDKTIMEFYFDFYASERRPGKKDK